jgi:biopolymer transport protein ExbD
VGISANDGLSWNGRAIDEDTLKSSIARSLTMPDEPLLRFSPDPSASYDKSAKTIALIKDSGSKKFAFDGLHEHRKFDRAR